MAVDRGPEKSIADQKGEKLKHTRVEYLMHDLKRMGHDRPNREVVAKLVEGTFRGGLSLREKDELVELVMAAMRPQQEKTTGDEEAKVSETKTDVLTTERVAELATEYLKAHPKATADVVMKHVKKHGALPMKPVSFKTYTLVKIRKELGISGSSSVPKKRPKSKAGGAKKKPAADHPWRKQAAPAPEPEPTEPEPANPARADTATVTVSHDDGSQADEPETFRIEMPAGEITAVRRNTSEPWRVTMEADLNDDTLAELVRDLVASLPIDVAGGW